jgi:hypothetical protein
MIQIRQRIDASIRHFPGGYAEMARQLGLTERYLMTAIENLGVEKGKRSAAKLGVVESQRIAHITGDESWVQDIAHFHGFRLVPIPAPSCDSALPEDHATNALRALGHFLAVTDGFDGATVAAVGSVNGWAAVVAELAGQQSITKNKRFELSTSFLDIRGQPTFCPMQGVKLNFWLQLASDASRATRILEERCSIP